MRIKGFCRFSENTSEIIGLSGYGRLGLEVRMGLEYWARAQEHLLVRNDHGASGKSTNREKDHRGHPPFGLEIKTAFVYSQKTRNF